MFLIMSAAYVGQDLQSEFGKIPPSFLPLGNKRLFQHQVKLAPKGLPVHLSIPESYQVTKTDLIWLESNGVTLIRTPDNICLGASLIAALKLSEHDLNLPFHVLFGDTLFTELPDGDNVVCVSKPKDSYDWAFVTDDEMYWFKDKIEFNNQNVVNGYFKFNQPRHLMRALIQSNWQFIEGLNRYYRSVGATTVYSDKWLDFGHANTYYRSKANFTTQRAFNELTITPDWVEKSSSKVSKISAEANWFATLPFSLRGYIPQYLGSSEEEQRVSYRLEYLHQTALNELYVFGELPVNIWEQILQKCVEFLKACLMEKAPEGETGNGLAELFGKKTAVRLEEFCWNQSISMTERWTFNDRRPVSLETVLQDSQKHLPKESSEWTASVLHGDFCFSNILYDFRSNRVKTIDPRGATPDGTHTLYGDVRYDIAKLSHSILGMYDWIIAGYYEVDINGNQIHLELGAERNKKHSLIQQRYVQLVEQEFGINEITLMAMQIQLFLSMLPLHQDDPKRQQALFANAFRLHNLMKRLEQ